MTRPLLFRIMRIAATIGVLTAALCLLGGCGYLYLCLGGFTQEHVEGVFRAISLPLYLGLSVAALGVLLDAALPQKRRRISAVRQDGLVLRRLRAHTDLNSCPNQLRLEILAQRRAQRSRSAILLVPAALTWAAFGWYLLGSRFSQTDINGTVLGCVGALIPGLALWLCWSMAVTRKNSESCRREIGLLKQAAPPEKNAVQPVSPQYGRYLRYPLLAVAVFLLIWGLTQGGAADVLTKAVNICTECIGLG